MVLDLKRVFSGLDSEQPFSHALDLTGVEIEGVFPFVLPVALSGRVTGRSGMFFLDYEARFPFRMACFRCMEDFEEEFSFSFHHALLATPGEEPSDAYLVAEEERLDMDAVAYTDILLEIPTKYLCAPDCRGLCPQCGKNLNEGPCDCKRDTVDPRLEALRALL